MNFPLLYNILLVLFELWGLSGIVLILHRFSPRFGLAPLLIFLGAAAAVLQFDVLGWLSIKTESSTLVFHAASYTLLPAILLGLLIIYVVNGSTQTRYVFNGIMLISLLSALFQVLPAFPVDLPSVDILPGGMSTMRWRVLLASVLTLMLDVIVLIVVYQVTSNLLHRFPSRLGGLIALNMALWADAVIFPVLAYLGAGDFTHNMLAHLAGKTLATLLISPLVVVYLQTVAPSLPATSATTPRPALDLFTTSLQLEARTRYQHRLLRIISQISQLIVRSTEASELLGEVCRLLVEDRNYDLAWIELTVEGSAAARLAAMAGMETSFLSKFPLPCKELNQGCDPASTARITNDAVIINQISRYHGYPEWREAAHGHGFHSCAAFPIRYTGRILGSLSVSNRHSDVFAPDEIDLLQELADDLAYALVNLETRRQEAVLEAGARNMQDGLFITDMDGKIIYLNPAGAQIFARPRREMVGENLHSFLRTDEGHRVLNTYLEALQERGQISGEFESTTPDGRTLFAAIRASLVRKASGAPAHIVLSVQDISLRRKYEHQLLTLTHFVNELVQIYDTDLLLNSALKAGEELLEANASAVYLVGPDPRVVIQTLTHHLNSEYAARIARDYRGLPGEKALKTLQTVYVENVMASEEYGERIHFMAEYGIHALLILPVLFQEHQIGALTLYYHQPHTFHEQELQVGLTLSQTLAITLQNARLYQSEHAQRELAEALVQAAAVLNSSLDLDEVLDQILEQTMRVASSSSVNIMLVDGDVAYLARRRGYDKLTETLHALDTVAVSLSTTTLNHMVTTGQPLLIADTQNDSRWSRLPGTNRIMSYAGAPLQIEREVVGFLNVDNDQPNFFTHETTRRLQAFAAHAAIAIQNARMYQRLQQHASELETHVSARTAELQAAKERIEGILASVPDAVFVLDGAGRMVQANQAGESLLAAAHAELLDLFAPNVLANLVSSDTPSEKNLLQVGKRAFQPLASGLALDGQPSGRILVFRDVTRFRELDAMKTQFVSDVSHELRTPLTNLTIYLDLLSSTKDPVRSASYLETLRRETGRLTHLIEDLLTISRLEANRVEIFIKPVDVNRLVSDLAQDRIMMANSRGLLLSCDPAAENLCAQADQRLLNQALSNLLTNAINYTPAEGAICMKTTLAREESAAWVAIQIIDNGNGIPQNEAALIFERFYRGSASHQTSAPGTGLGLPISKEIIERMGGRITVESELGKGSTFTVWLPAVL